ncbi:MAG: hypothetical protein ACMVO5_00635 [Polymorphobacter sp.]|uniref:hypothetical protein n=1 Tax=Polymorphobacter sp. TaxID=1909290 RepID=UPI003A85BA9F
MTIRHALIVGVSTLGLASPSFSQSRTTCYNVGLNVVCDSDNGSNWQANQYPPVLVPNFMESFQRGQAEARQRQMEQLEIEQRQQQLAESRAAAQREQAAVNQAENEKRNAIAKRNRVQTTVSDYLNIGWCDAAIDAALDAGEIDIAASAKSFCAAKD